MSDYIFGCIPSDPDHRDYVYKQIVAPISLPARYNRERECSPVRSQGDWGTCAAFAGAGIKDWQERRNYNRDMVMSPLFLYKQCKQLDGKPEEEGTDLRTVMKVLKDYGICTEENLPYENIIMDKPTWPKVLPPCKGQIDAAKEYVVKSYARLYSIEDIKQAIYQSGPVMAGIFLCENFRKCNGYIPMPEGNILGGHAVVITGWDDSLVYPYPDKTRKGFLRIRNSWGTGWGEHGYAWMPYDYYYGKLDFGMPYFFEAWSSVDLVIPVRVEEIVLWLNEKRALINGKETTLDQAPVLDKTTNRTLVPLRFIGENMGWTVEYTGGKITMRKRLSTTPE